MQQRRPSQNLTHLENFFNDIDDAISLPKSSQELAKLKKLSEALLWYLDAGQIRVLNEDLKTVNAWVKKAILAYFKTSKAKALSSGCFEYFDKLTPKKRSALKNVRVVPGAIARYGSFIESGAVLMPSFINIGAYVGTGTLVDTWATVGSCAYVGSNVHLSGGVGIGGVLEPPQASPVIIEDGAFIGSRAIVVEGVRVGCEAVLGAGVVLTASTKIVDTRGFRQTVLKGEIPSRAVVIPGTMPKEFPSGTFGVPCALIIGTRKESTDLKTSLNDALRTHQVAV